MRCLKQPVGRQVASVPHLHAAIRSVIPRATLKQVVKATYVQVWWPAFVASERKLMADIITFPAGLTGRVCGVKVREERVLADR